MIYNTFVREPFAFAVYHFFDGTFLSGKRLVVMKAKQGYQQEQPGSQVQITNEVVSNVLGCAFRTKDKFFG